MKGIAVSQGSACSSGLPKPSSVLSKILSEETKQNTTPLRISFSHKTTKEEIDALVNALVEILKIIEKDNGSHRQYF
jgi:cysteine desulfurase